MHIPKYPEVPKFTEKQIEEITKIVFCDEQELGRSDVIFIFGSTQPENYQKALEAYNKGFGRDIVISGGSSGSIDKHKDWNYGSKSEAYVIYKKLLDQGVPEERMFLEENATNSKENVIFAKKVYDFSKVKRLIFISKNYAAGRQYRTLRKYLPQYIKICPYSYSTYFDEGMTFNRYDWMKHKKSRSLVFGEYLRILFYGQKGDIEELKDNVEGLEKHIEKLFAK